MPVIELSCCYPVVEIAALLQFIECAKADLGSVAELSGRVFYSSVETLRPGPLYSLGINPGPDLNGLDYTSIRASLDDFPNYRKNAYRDEAWDPGAPAGSDPLQRNWLWLIESLGFSVDTVCASNIAFPRTRAASEAKRFVRACWPVHKRILDIVQPNFVLVFGQLPLEALIEPLHLRAIDSFLANHQTWTCDVFCGEFNGRPVKILKVPHLGRRYAYAPPLPLDIARLRRHVD